MTNLCINYKSTWQWDKNDASSYKSIISLETALTKERSKNASNGETGEGKVKGSRKNHPDLPTLRVKNVGKHFTCPDGDKWVCCKHHGRKKDDCTQQGMYMPRGYGHDICKIKKDESKAAFKDKQKSSKAAVKRNAPESEASSKKTKTDKSEKTLSLSKSFMSYLTTRVNLSDTIFSRWYPSQKRWLDRRCLKIVGPELKGSINMDKLDICIIPLIYLFRMTLTF